MPRGTPFQGVPPAAGPPLPELVLVQQQGKASLWLEKRRRHPLLLKLSETLTVVVRVDSDEPVEVNELQEVPKSDGWWLRVLYQPPEGVEHKHWHKVYQLAPLKPGTHLLKLPNLRYGDGAGDDTEVRWEPLTVYVTTRVAKADVSEARDITTIEEVPPPAAAAETDLVWLWALVLVPVVVAVLGVVWLRRRRSYRAGQPSPREVVLRRLEELRQEPLDSAAQVERWHIRLAELLRRYVEKELHLPATRQTTTEFLLALEQNGKLAVEEQAQLSALLAQCDLAKFARVVPAREDCWRLVEAARAFVNREAAA
jgi:hypothetical protein